MTPQKLIQSKAITPTGCWEHPTRLEPRVYLSFGGEYEPAYRHIYKFIHGSIPDDLHVLHHCDNPRCYNPDHLFLGTPQDNIDDMKRKGRQSKGGNHHKSILTENQIQAIRVDSRTQVEIASQYCISQARVSRIKSRKSWSHVQ